MDDDLALFLTELNNVSAETGNRLISLKRDPYKNYILVTQKFSIYNCQFLEEKFRTFRFCIYILYEWKLLIKLNLSFYNAI